MSTLTNAFTPSTVLAVAYSSLAVTGAVMVGRIVLQVYRGKWPTVSDYFVFLGFAFHITMCGLYVAVVPLMKRVYTVLDGRGPTYPNFNDERIIMAKLIFAAISMFFTVLWGIKFSLLFLYRRLLTGVNKFYTMVWWAILILCVLTHIVNYVLYFQSCGTPSGFWRKGCYGKSAHHTQLRSLFYSFAADTATNILIMALPIHLTWDLKMPRGKKIGIVLLFASGVVCILFSVLRVAQIASNATKAPQNGQYLPIDPTWTGLWGMAECSTAVVIGCCPSFAVLFNSWRKKSSSKYNSQGYRRQTYAATLPKSPRTPMNNIHMTTITSVKSQHTDRHWSEMHTRHSSQEELARNHDGILVTTTFQAEKEGL